MKEIQRAIYIHFFGVKQTANFSRYILRSLIPIVIPLVKYSFFI